MLKEKEIDNCIAAAIEAISKSRKEEYIKKLEAEHKSLKEFTRRVIREICWGFREPDGGDIQELAEKLGLIHSVIATEEDVSEESEFEVGDTIYKFTDMLKGGA